MFSTRELVDDAKEIQELCKGVSLTDALKIAVEHHRNKVLAGAFMVSQSSEAPPVALEAIAIALGFKMQLGTSISEALTTIAESIDNHATT
ncbi:hypothetical protein [Fibrella aquatica]|uniref:hypothetical protein n=1 Tax=Fibrella aquatica TaxID=3242487 RepID=UPI00351FF104